MSKPIPLEQYETKKIQKILNDMEGLAARGVSEEDLAVVFTIAAESFAAGYARGVGIDPD